MDGPIPPAEWAPSHRPSVNGVGVVGHAGDPAPLDPGQGRDYIFAMPPRRSSKKDSPAKLASRMKRRWRVVLLRAKGRRFSIGKSCSHNTGSKGSRCTVASPCVPAFSCEFFICGGFVVKNSVHQ